MRNLVVIYTKSNCGYCIQAKTLLNVNKVSYKEISVDDLDNLEKFKYDYPRLRTMPQIFVENEEQSVLIGGYTELEAYYRKFREDPINDLYGIFYNH